MRIIDEINRGDLKVTVFRMNERLSVKFEKDLTEIVYKFRDGSGFDEKNYKTFLSDALLMKVETVLYTASVIKNEALIALDDAEDALPEII